MRVSINLQRPVHCLAGGLISLLLGSVATLAAASGQEFECLIEPVATVKVATPTAGVIKSVMVERGSLVRKEQTVATIEAGVEEVSLALAEARAQGDATIKARRARLEFLTRKHSRLERLLATSAVSVAVADEAETEVKLAQAELNEALLNQHLASLEQNRAAELVKQRTIVSPVDGIVTEQVLSRGEYAYEQVAILTVAQLHPLNVEMFAPTALFGTIRVGMVAEVRPEEPIGGVHPARVHVVDRVFDQRSGTFGIRLRMDNIDVSLPAGIRCKVRFPSLPGQ